MIFVQGHKTSKWQSQNQTPGLLGPPPVFFCLDRGYFQQMKRSLGLEVSVKLCRYVGLFPERVIPGQTKPGALVLPSLTRTFSAGNSVSAMENRESFHQATQSSFLS